MKPTLPRRIYVASSWRNTLYPAIVEQLRSAGHDVYDFRNPAPGQQGFAWRDCGGEAATDGPGSGARTIPAYLEAVQSERAQQGFALDKAALDWCDTCILVLPCGRSAHLEAGYAAGQGKDVYFLLHPDRFEPELMYLLGTRCATSVEQILGWMREHQPADVLRWHQESGGKFIRPANHAVRLLREVVELCVAAGASQKEITGAVSAELVKALGRGEIGGNPGDLPEEWADCAMLLEVFARHAGIDKTASIRSKLAIIWTREWEADAGGALYRPRAQQGEPRFAAFVDCRGVDPEVGAGRCGTVGLTPEQYAGQLAIPDRPWRCPKCGGDAFYNDDLSEQVQGISDEETEPESENEVAF